MGRFVRKGEKGIAILAPIVGRREAESDGDNARTVVGFRAAYVFDVEQTDGEPLPEPGEASGDPGAKTASLKAAILAQGIALESVDDLGGALGTSSGGRIRLLNGLSPAMEFTTLVHEYAHELLHHADDRPASRDTRELEAEAVAFVVGEAVGLDTSDVVTRLHPLVSRRPRGARAVAHTRAADGVGDSSGDRGRCVPGTPTLIGGPATATHVRVQRGVYPRAGRVYDCGYRVVASDRATSGGRDGQLDVVMSMSTASRSPSLLRVIAWACLGPFAALGGLALLVFGFGALAVGVRLLLALFGHGGV